MAAYYNEIDPKTAAWLRELMKAGLIADGEVDTRSIVDVRPDDLRGFVQCHFFAGIGGWSYALRLARWDDTRPVWTGSCPCQPFSSAGTQAGGDDPRDLWPVWFKLIAQCRPHVVFGEQVEAAIGHGWLDRLCDDLESTDYAVGACGLPAPSVGAFHRRQRLWFVAESAGDAGGRIARVLGADASQQSDKGTEPAHRRAHGGLADDAVTRRATQPERSDRADGRPTAESRRLRVTGSVVNTDRSQQRRGRTQPERQVRRGSTDGGELGDAVGARLQEQRRDAGVSRSAGATNEGQATLGTGASISGLADSDGSRTSRLGEHGGPTANARETLAGQRAPVSGFWDAVDWLRCSDGKARPVEPGTFPLAHGVPARVGRLRGYGNAIVPEVAAAFIEAYEVSRNGARESCI
jgi:DNA (cytosine-5)-methyltransferase 1